MQIDALRTYMESVGLWYKGPKGNPTKLSHDELMKLVDALLGVVGMCCEVAKMEGVDMNTLLKRTYETCASLSVNCFSTLWG